MTHHQTHSNSRKKTDSNEFHRKPELNPKNTKGRITKDPNSSNLISKYLYSPFLPKFTKPAYAKPTKNLTPLENEQIKREYTLRTLSILNTIYPKRCNCPKSLIEPTLNFLRLKSKESIARCSHCHRQISITANTPFQNIKLPLAYISYTIQDQILQYPKTMTSKEIARKLGLPYKTAYYLRKRIQVFFSHLNETLREQLYKELEESSKNFRLPKEGDLKETLKNQPVAVADSVVLYSSSLRANKHRSRRFKGGTASIYASNSIGGHQIGTLVHTIGINGGMTFYKSIPLNNQHYLEKDLEETIPKNVTLFTDEGYGFLWDRPNHKSVNHSKKSNDPRYNMSRERWVSKDGVSSNGAEARNNILKQSFRSYGYISPKWSQLALSELSFLGNVRFVPELKELLILGSSKTVGFGDFHCSKGDSTSPLFGLPVQTTLRGTVLFVASLPGRLFQIIASYGRNDSAHKTVRVDLYVLND